VPLVDPETELVLVRTGGARGVVVRPDGTPIAGAMVSSNYERDGSFQSWNWREGEATRTDEEGLFELDDLPPGKVQLRASSGGLAASAPLDLVLVSATTLEDIRIELRVGGRLTGEVHGAVGQIAGRRVTVTSHELDVHVRLDTDEVGRFEIDALQPGDYAVQLEPLERPAASQQVFYDEFTDPRILEQVQVPEGGTAHVVLGAPPENAIVLFGTVTAGGAPLAATPVQAIRRRDRNPRKYGAVTDAQGAYRLTVDGPGDYLFRIGSDSASRARISAKVPDVDELQLDFALAGGRIAGRVRLPDGGPGEGVAVSLEHQSFTEGTKEHVRRNTKSDAEGRFAFPHLPPGVYVLRAGDDAGGLFFGGGTPGDWAPRLVTDIELEEDTHKDDFDLRLPAPAVLLGTVLDAGGNPLENAFIQLTDSSGRRFSQFGISGRSGPDGRFEVRNAPPGTVLVTAQHGQQHSEAVAVELRSRGTTSVELVIQPE